MSCPHCRAEQGLVYCPFCDPEPEYRECEDCQGTGQIFYAYNINTAGLIEVSEDLYRALPRTEDAARARGFMLVRSEACLCDSCAGTGEVEVKPEPIDEWDYVDPDNYHDTRWER